MNQWIKHRGKAPLVCVLLCALTAFTPLSGCAPGKETPPPTPLPTGYTERQATLPQTRGIAQARVLADDSLALLEEPDFSGAQPPRVFLSQDGVTWQERALSAPPATMGQPVAGRLDETGQVSLLTLAGQEGDLLMLRYVTLAEDGSAVEKLAFSLPADAFPISFLPTGTGDLLVETSSCIYQLDSDDGSVKFKYLEGTSEDPFTNAVKDYLCEGDRLAVTYKDTITWYSLENGEMLNSFQTEPVSDRFYSPGPMRSYGRERLLAIATGGESLFYCDQNGLFSRVNGGQLNERIFEGNATSLNLPTRKPLGLLPRQDGTFFILYEQQESYHLAEYVFSSEAPAQKTTLNVYSLMEFNNRRIRQAIGQHEIAHADTTVVASFGISEDARQTGAVSTSDALRVLSTQLLAGSGPDIIILDDLPTSALIEKGVLLDLTDLALQKTQSGEWVPQVVENLRFADGRIYGIPSAFTLPLMLGNPQDVDAIGNYTQLADYAVRAHEQNPDNLPIDYLHPGMLVENFYPLCSNAWLRGESPQREAAAAFISDTQRIAALGGEDTPIPNHDLYYEGWYKGQVSLAVGELNSLYDLAIIGSLLDTGEREGKLALLPGDKAGYYIPKKVAGLNANSPNLEKAQAFLETLMSDDVQQHDYFDGLPVRMDVLRRQMQSTAPMYTLGFNLWDLNDTSYPIESTWPNPQYEALFWSLLESVSIPAYPDPTIEELFFDRCYQAIVEDPTQAQANLSDFWATYELQQAQ